MKVNCYINRDIEQRLLKYGKIRDVVNKIVDICMRDYSDICFNGTSVREPDAKHCTIDIQNEQYIVLLCNSPLKSPLTSLTKMIQWFVYNNIPLETDDTLSYVKSAIVDLQKYNDIVQDTELKNITKKLEEYYERKSGTIQSNNTDLQQRQTG